MALDSAGDRRSFILRNWLTRAHRDPSRGLVLGLVIAHLVLKICLLPSVVTTPLTGDEGFYNTGARWLARALHALLSGVPVPAAELRTAVIAYGWFMPGMSLVLTPLYFVVAEPSVLLVRVYIGALSTGLLLIGVAMVHRALGARYAAFLLIFPGLVPLWVVFSYTTWGDLMAGLMLVVIVAVLIRLWKTLTGSGRVRVRDGLLLGWLLAATLYLRSSALPLVLLVLALVLVAVLLRGYRRVGGRAFVGWGVAVATFVGLLLPWSYAASSAFGERVVTTTTVPISMAYAFGDRDELCLGPCRPGNPWYAMVEYSRQVSARTGETELEVQRRMAAYALRDTTPQSYASDVLAGFHRYVLEPTGYEPVFRVQTISQEPAPAGPVSWGIVWFTTTMYFTVLLLALAGILLVRAMPETVQLAGLLSALLGGALMSQPFVHVASPRYWPVFAPMMALSAAGLLFGADRRRSNRWLRWLQVAAAVGWVVVIGGLVIVAASG